MREIDKATSKILRYTATSGNVCLFKLMHIGLKIAIDASWERTPSVDDLEEGTVWCTAEVCKLTGSPVAMHASIDEDDARREASYRKFLGGGQG